MGIITAAAMIRLVPLLLLVMCVSCTEKNTRWACDQMHSGSREFRSSKLTYCSGESLRGIDLEIIQTEQQLKSYLSVHSFPVPLHNKETKSVHITYIIDDRSFETEGYRLQGGQKIQLNEALITHWLEALKEGKKIAIGLNGYRATITPEGWEKAFKKFQNPSLYPNPLEPNLVKFFVDFMDYFSRFSI